MIENRPGLKFLSHFCLIVAVLLVCFPIYLAFVASTQTAQDVVNVPLSLVPGDQFWTNYARALSGERAHLFQQRACCG